MTGLFPPTDLDDDTENRPASGYSGWKSSTGGPSTGGCGNWISAAATVC